MAPVKFSLPKVPQTANEQARAFRELRKLAEQLSADRGCYLTTADGAEDVPLVNGAVNKLRHRLGRKLRGWSLRDLRGATATGRLVRVVTSGGNPVPDDELWLDVQGHGANIIVRIWVE